MNASIGQYFKADLMKIFGLNQPQIDRLFAMSGNRLPVGTNVLDSRKIYTDETVRFLKEEFKLSIAVDPSNI